MKKICLLFGLCGLVSCDSEPPKTAHSENNILLKKQDELEGKAIRNANQLLEQQKKQLQQINSTTDS